MKQSVLIALVLSCLATWTTAQESVAREWNEVLLSSIRVDVGRPTVHARNLFHVSAAMYDAWAVYDEVADPYLIGKEVHGFSVPFDGVEIPKDDQELKDARNTAVSYASYRMLRHRFKNSPGVATARAYANALMAELALDTAFTSTDYVNDGAAALGNYIAETYISYGLQDGSNEAGNYSPAGFNYSPANLPLAPNMPGTGGISDLDRWQPLSFSVGTQTPFLNPHWGSVFPFALEEEDLTQYERNGSTYNVYHDPGPPPLHTETPGLADDYKWTFALVALWSGHMDSEDPTIIDISPQTVGNIADYPETIAEMRTFYDLEEGGVQDVGYTINPVTGYPYEANNVRRGDFARVCAEFWADGPASETPPGHWFTLLNYVSDHPLFEKRFGGEGPILDDLEWDVKSYFTLGSAMHDVAISVWGIKAWYDYVRPISAIRGMAELGQSSDTAVMSYHPGGIPLIPGRIEVVFAGDPLAGPNDENVGKIKLFAWRGPSYIGDPLTQYAGCGWILAENWWPYQRPTFVTPPFAGYISGHSTFSRAAAETLAMLTGDEYFPGGLGEFNAAMNSYLVFEDGPSESITLQWAKYRDASDQASLSRIWGGIHPPVDDIPGRRIGAEVAGEVFALAEAYFEGTISSVDDVIAGDGLSVTAYPNPVTDLTTLSFALNRNARIDLTITDLNGRVVKQLVKEEMASGEHRVEWNVTGDTGESVPGGVYLCKLQSNGISQPIEGKIVVVR